VHFYAPNCLIYLSFFYINNLIYRKDSQYFYKIFTPKIILF